MRTEEARGSSKQTLIVNMDFHTSSLRDNGMIGDLL
jgi:hypothetical protein